MNEDKPWLVTSRMGTPGNEGWLEKWFDTKQEAECWISLMQKERPAKYFLMHRDELDPSY